MTHETGKIALIALLAFLISLAVSTFAAWCFSLNLSQEWLLQQALLAVLLWKGLVRTEVE